MIAPPYVKFAAQPDQTPEYKDLRHWGLFDGLVFGPVESRRFGRSLGINPLPENQKVCTFDCPYCECGRTVLTMEAMNRMKYPELTTIEERLRTALSELREIPPDTLTFTGNGEPTMHPEFPELVDIVIDVRNALCSGAELALLTNGTYIGRTKIAESLKKLDVVMIKLDAGTAAVMQAIDMPLVTWDPGRVVRAAERLNNVVLQSMFLEGTIDNTKPEEIAAWLRMVEQINPVEVCIYTLDRVPPSPGLRRVPDELMENIGRQVGGLGISWRRL